MAALRLPAPPAARLSHLPTPVSASAAARRVSPPRHLAARRAKGEDTPEPPVRTLLINNYDSYTYNIFQELSVVNGGEYESISPFFAPAAASRERRRRAHCAFSGGRWN